MDELKKNKSDVTGFILAGGKSRRFGTDKRELLIAGQSMLARTIGLLKTLLNREPYVVGDNLVGLDIGNVKPLKDARPDSGPLGGIVSALEECPTKWALILAADLPNITVKDLEILFLSMDESFDIIALSSKTIPEPLIALYNQKTLSFWKERLSQEKLTLSEGLLKLKCKTVPPFGGEKSLYNINSPEDINVINSDK